MKERLPVDIENNLLPVDTFRQNDKRKTSYGFANILYFLSMIITALSLLSLIILGK